MGRRRELGGVEEEETAVGMCRMRDESKKVNYNIFKDIIKEMLC